MKAKILGWLARHLLPLIIDQVTEQVKDKLSPPVPPKKVGKRVN